ncbi:unnamed protein product [marine sediment metagenome]|uniref:Uncharacterized protein n=1 Tax=marine sediment metagenome TaxID=412755 RepID=X1HV32_9ZZZZ
MAIPDKYVAGQSTGTPFETGNTVSVVVTAEALSSVSGYEGDSVTYTATVKDGAEASLPATFVADLEIDSTKVLTGQAFDVAVYDQATSLLTLVFTVPSAVGTFTVKLVWAEQLI